MAYSFATTKLYSRYIGRNFYQFDWTELTEAITNPDEIANILGCMSFWVKAAGTWGTGGHVKLQGSMDNTNWYTLQSGSADIDFTGNGTKFLDANQMFRYVRAIVTAGTGVDVDVTLVAAPK